MIEKLDIIKYSENCINIFGNRRRVAGDRIITKINEVVDAVNNQQIQLNNHECRLLGLHRRITALDDPTYHEEPAENVQDKFAEQRKWIGTLCRCWDSDINDDIWGILQDIKDNKTEKYYLYGIGYEHCEPVKPDDDIIYKGDNNE